MARNDKAIAARDKAEDDLTAELVNLATVDAALAMNEATWLTSPLIDRSRGGVEGNENYSYSSYLNYWNGRRNSIMATITALEALIEALNRRVSAQEPPWVTQYVKVKL